MPISTQNLLEHMAIPRMPGMYLLGSLERRVTIYSQQMRALNLLYALFDRGQAGKHTRMAIVGGGVAGMTLAIAAARKGCQVVLLEKESRLLHLLDGCTSRWVHPRIYDWPHPNAKREDAELPIMSWSADTAANIAKKLTDQFYQKKDEYLYRVETYLNCHDIEYFPIMRDGKRWYLIWNSQGRKSGNFDIVVWATGFGLERTIAPLNRRSYWRDDDLHQGSLDGKGRTSFLISGCGDGGLTDLLRARITGFSHYHVLRDLITKAELDQVAQSLIQIEESAMRQSDPATQAAVLETGYRSLRTSETTKWLKNRMRTDTVVTLNSPNPIPYVTSASILNRYITFCLLDIGGIDYWVGEIKEIQRAASGQFQVLMATTPQKGEQSKSFDQIVIRHGAIPPLLEWPELWSHCQELRSRNLLDQTREQLWDVNWWFTNVAQPSVYQPIELRSSLMAQARKLIYEHLPEESEFDAFCVDYNPASYSRFYYSGINRQQRITSLIHDTSPEWILDVLREKFPGLMPEAAQIIPIKELPASIESNEKMTNLILSTIGDFSELKAFCSDYFPETYRLIGETIERNHYLDILISRNDWESIYSCIAYAFPEELKLFENPLSVPVPTTESLKRFLQEFPVSYDIDSKLRVTNYTQILTEIRERFPQDYLQHSRVLEPASVLSSHETRRLLERACPLMTQFNEFCQRHFRDAWLQFTTGMDKSSRITLLLSRGRDPRAMILIRLREDFPKLFPSSPETEEP